MSGSGVGRVVRWKDRWTTHTVLQVPRNPLQLTLEKKQQAVGETETTQLILRPNTNFKKYLPFAETNWEDSASVTLAEFFDAYQEEKRRYVNDRIATSLRSSTITMVQKPLRLENVNLDNAVHNLDFDLSKMQHK
jgi:hypothetical protein